MDPQPSKKRKKIFVNDDDGQSMKFYTNIRPLWRELRELIEDNGGIMLDKPERDIYKLVKEGMAVMDSKDYYLSSYIHDSIDKGEKLDIIDYRIAIVRGKAVKHPHPREIEEEEQLIVDEDDDWDESVDYNFSPAKKRLKYSLDEDMRIMKYLIDRKEATRAKGNEVWKRMERKKITKHSWSSMKDRFRRQIMTNLDRYKLPPSSFKYLTYCAASFSNIKSTRVSVKTDITDEEDDDARPSTSTCTRPIGTNRHNRQMRISVAIGKMPPNVANIQMPANVAIGKMPANVANIQIPANVTNGQMPANVANGQIPANVASGQMPANVANGQIPADVLYAKMPADLKEEFDELVEELIEDYAISRQAILQAFERNDWEMDAALHYIENTYLRV